MASSVQLLALLFQDGQSGEICRFRVPPVQVEITRLVRDGERLLETGRPEEAVTRFRDAGRLIRNEGFASAPRRELLPRVQERLARASGAVLH